MEAIIYKIICETTGDIYIGSSKNRQLSRRPLKPSHEFYENHNRNNCKTSVEEVFEYKTKEDILWKEREWIEKTGCINKRRPIITEEERDEMKLSGAIKWNNNNKERINKCRRKRYNYRVSWGDERYHNCLLKIDPFLFT